MVGLQLSAVLVARDRDFMRGPSRATTFPQKPGCGASSWTRALRDRKVLIANVPAKGLPIGVRTTVELRAGRPVSVARHTDARLRYGISDSPLHRM
jgi:hypothetical protein